MADKRLRDAVELAETYADGHVSGQRLAWARHDVGAAMKQIGFERWTAEAENDFKLTKSFCLVEARELAAAAVNRTVSSDLDEVRGAHARAAKASALYDFATSPGDNEWCREEGQNSERAELKQQAHVLRCLFGDALRSQSAADRPWRTRGVPALAQRIYDDHCFEHTPDLAALLTDCRCSDVEMLEHLRSPDKHYHGCWVIDALLERD